MTFVRIHSFCFFRLWGVAGVGFIGVGLADVQGKSNAERARPTPGGPEGVFMKWFPPVLQTLESSKDRFLQDPSILKTLRYWQW